MKITLHGTSGGEVTGSAYLVETRSANVLIDSSLFQGSARVEAGHMLGSASLDRPVHGAEGVSEPPTSRVTALTDGSPT